VPDLGWRDPCPCEFAARDNTMRARRELCDFPVRFPVLWSHCDH